MSEPDSGAQAQQAASAALVQLRTKVDAHFEQAVQRQPESFACAAGCDACCHQDLSVFEIEAARMQAALQQLEVDDPTLRERLRARARQRLADRDERSEPANSSSEACALLDGGRCSIYAERPLICRSHGLPVLTMTGPARAEVDHCPLNFTGTAPARESLLQIERINEPLVVMAGMWSGARDGRRVSLTQLAAQ